MNNFTKKIFSIFLLTITILCPPAFADDVAVTINGVPVEFDVPPTIVESRTLVPVRAIFEALNIELTWDDKTKTVFANYEDVTIIIPIGSKFAYKNSTAIEMDVPATIIEGRTLVPVRFISENLGLLVSWDNDTRTVVIENNDIPTDPNIMDTTDTTEPDTETDQTTENIVPSEDPPPTEEVVPNDDTIFNLLGIKIGDLESEVISAFGQPNRMDLSKYGFTWYVYNGDYSRYIQFGILDGKVVGLYSNSDIWNYKNLSYGVLKNKAQEVLGDPLEVIRKENTLYTVLDKEKEESNIFFVDGGYLTLFYDTYEDSKILSFEIIEKKVEESLLSFYGTPSDELRYAFELQIFDITNSTRVNRTLLEVSYDELISVTARNHSEDMVARDYFAHENLDGKSPFDRIDDDGILYRYAAENLAYGATTSHQAVNNWMNSLAHRNALLSDVERLGVGTAFYEDGRTTHTQNFYTPLN